MSTSLSTTAPTRSLPNTSADRPTQLRRENAQLREQLAKLAALVDHYYSAHAEARNLLDRRDRELAELRRKMDCMPVPVRK